MPMSQPQFPNPSNTQIQLSPEQSAYQKAQLGFLQSQIGQTAAPYPGQLVAPLVGDQATGLGQVAAEGQFATGPTTAALSSLGGIASGNYLFDPFTAGVLGSTADYARQQFYNQDLPAIQAPFISASGGGFSTPMINAESQAARQFETGLAGTLGQEALGSYNQRLQGMQQAAEAAIPLGLSASAAGISALQQPQATNQQALSANYQDYLRQIQNPWLAVGSVPGLLSQPQGQTGPPVFGQSPFSSVFGGLTNLAGAALMSPWFRL